jgi:hypothetical protein
LQMHPDGALDGTKDDSTNSSKWQLQAASWLTWERYPHRDTLANTLLCWFIFTKIRHQYAISNFTKTMWLTILMQEQNNPVCSGQV